MSLGEMSSSSIVHNRLNNCGINDQACKTKRTMCRSRSNLGSDPTEVACCANSFNLLEHKLNDKSGIKDIILLSNDSQSSAQNVSPCFTSKTKQRSRKVKNKVGPNPEASQNFFYHMTKDIVKRNIEAQLSRFCTQTNIISSLDYSNRLQVQGQALMNAEYASHHYFSLGCTPSSFTRMPICNPVSNSFYASCSTFCNPYNSLSHINGSNNHKSLMDYKQNIRSVNK